MRFLEKVGHWLFIYSMRKQLIAISNFESRHINKDSKHFMYVHAHKAYKKKLDQITKLNSQHMTFNTLTKYIQHKMTTIEGHIKDGIR